jgi:hypothetical protein
MRFYVYLRTINRVLRWTGWRLYIGIDIENLLDDEKRAPAQIGLEWYGWEFIKHLDEDLVKRNET